MSASISAGVSDLPCFTSFYFYGPCSNLKFLVPVFIIMTGELAHTTSKGKNSSK